MLDNMFVNIPEVNHIIQQNTFLSKNQCNSECFLIYL